MDAISFVLGVKATTLRGKKVKDLLYKSGGKSQNSGYVSMHFVTKAGRNIVFTRLIKSGGESEFQIDGKTKTREEYDRNLGDLGVLVSVKNCLVFQVCACLTRQGDVIDIAHLSPKGIGEMIETISGSLQHKEEYDRLKASVASAEDTMVSVFSKKKHLNAEKKSIKEQVKEAEKFASLQKQLVGDR